MPDTAHNNCEPRDLVIGTRGSALALWQARTVAAAIEAAIPGCHCGLRIFKTEGDRVLDVALSQLGDKGLFTKELEQALVDGEVDICVHSMKDVLTVLPAGCTIGGMLPRAVVRDVLVCGPRVQGAQSLGQLPAGAREGTGSLRRAAQLRAQFPHLEPKEIRGNVDTRLAKSQGEAYEAVILAAAGLDRLGLGQHITQRLSIEEMLPAAGQAAIGMEIRESDPVMAQVCAAVGCADTLACVMAERFIMKELEGGCQVPIGVYARRKGANIPGWVMDAAVMSLDGARQARVHQECEGNTPDDLHALAERTLAELERQGAREILAQVRQGGCHA